MSWQRLIVVVGLTLVTASVACGEDEKKPEEVDPTSRQASTAEKGAEAVVKRKCVDCHGMNMAGAVKKLEGPAAGTDIRVELYPPNLTPDVATGLGDPNETDPAKKGYTDELLARAIREGYDRADQQLCPQMKHFSDMTDFEVYSIVKYLRALPPVNQKILRSVCPPLKTKEEQTASQ